MPLATRTQTDTDGQLHIEFYDSLIVLFICYSLHVSNVQPTPCMYVCSKVFCCFWITRIERMGRVRERDREQERQEHKSGTHTSSLIKLTTQCRHIEFHMFGVPIFLLFVGIYDCPETKH